MHLIKNINRLQSCTQLLNKLLLHRNISISPILNNKDITGSNLEWKSSVKEAERVVGYPTSFLNLRWLLNDEIANVAMYLRKLVGTEHPLLKIAKNCLFKNDVPGWGLIVLLLSKAGGLNKNKEFSEVDRDATAGILHSQRVLAEVTEMMRTAILIHKGILHVEKELNDEDINYENKLALLSGDYLLSKSFSDLASLRNQEVNFLISSALRDLSESEFLTPTDRENRHLPTKPSALPDTGICDKNNLDFGPYKVNDILGNSKDEWVLRNLLSGANLLGKSCQASILLAGHEESLQEKGYLFGKHIALAWQASIELEAFLTSDDQFSLVGAPVLLHLKRDASLYEEIEKGLDNLDCCDFKKIRNTILDGPALQETRDLQREYTKRSLDNLKEFDGNLSAKDALTKIISCM